MAPSRYPFALVAIAVAAAAGAAVFVWQRSLGSVYDDSVAYLVMAQAMDPWSRPSAAIAAAFPNEKYPPAFPFAVALLGGAHDWRIAHLVVAIAFGASVLLCGRYALATTGSRAIAVASALTLALLPGSWLNLKGVLSEFPYLALSLAALLQHRALGLQEAPRAGGWVALGVLLAAVLLTRTIGVALVAAVGAAEALRAWRARDASRLRGTGIALAVPVVAASLWYLLRPAGGEDSYMASSTGVVRGALEHGPAWVLDAIGVNAAAMGFSWLQVLLIFWASPLQPGALLGIALGIVAAVGSAWRAARGEADGLYVAFFLLILLLWPFPYHIYRLGLPVVPVMLVCGWWALQRVPWRGAAEGRWRARVAPWSSFAPLALCIPALLFYIVQRALLPQEAAEDGYRQTDITEFYRIPSGPMAASLATRQIGIFRDMDRIRATIPETARVMVYLPSYVALLAQREGVLLPETAEAGRLAQAVRERRAAYIYVSRLRFRDEGTGGSDPLAPARLAAAYSDTVWTRYGENQRIEAIFLKVDPERLASVRP